MSTYHHNFGVGMVGGWHARFEQLFTPNQILNYFVFTVTFEGEGC